MSAMDCPWFIWCHLLWMVRLTVEADSSAVFQLLSSIKNQDNFNYLLFMKYHNSRVSEKFLMDQPDGNCFVKSLMESLQTPVVQLDEHANNFLYEKHSSLVLSVVYLIGMDLDENESLLNALVANLRLMTISRVVFMVQLGETNETFLDKLFTYCWKMKLLNVLAVFESYNVNKKLYRNQFGILIVVFYVPDYEHLL